MRRESRVDCSNDYEKLIEFRSRKPVSRKENDRVFAHTITFASQQSKQNNYCFISNETRENIFTLAASGKNAFLMCV